ncbi:MAG: hypothetical protein HKN25_07275 [Pyrinomonadaceae bacterium]|nr:hypothetical protein [Pyrinomonadaceae bacterium]
MKRKVKIWLIASISGLFLTHSLFAQIDKADVLGTKPASVKNEVMTAPELKDDGDSPFRQTANSKKPENKLPQVAPYSRPDAGKRLKRYINSTIGPRSLGVTAVSAGFSTVTNNPEEWGKGGAGFARRFASNLGEKAVKETAIYGLDEALKVDSGFYRSYKRDIRSKVGNAVLSTFTARTKSGKRVVGVPRIVGTYGSKIIAREAWYPERYNYKDGLKSGTISLGINTALNLFREFVLN